MKCGNKALKTLFTLIGVLVFIAGAVMLVLKLIKRFCPELLCEFCDFDEDDDCGCCDDDFDDDDEEDEEDDEDDSDSEKE